MSFSQVCRICSVDGLEEVENFRCLPRITSDCVPFRAGGRLLICPHCHGIQSPADEQWFQEITEIYSNYRAYYQSGGIEQVVENPATGQLQGRSETLVACLLRLSEVPKSGRLLDVGCGVGATLKAFSRRGGWRLHGLEIDSKGLPLLKDIPGFEALYTCAPADLPSKFDLVTMVHALEHFPDPLIALRDLQGKIVDGGRLFVEVPNAAANAFDYLIADHMMHFTRYSLAKLAENAGLAVDCLSTAWVRKELSMVGRSGEAGTVIESIESAPDGLDHVYSQIDWLQRLVEVASASLKQSDCFGIFGTSIAATWLCSILGEKVSFFVEEDTNRVGRLHMGRPVISPTQVKLGSRVFMALAWPVATQIAARLSATLTDVVLPPPI